MTKSVLCFGDSNTWGLNPTTGKRFNEDTRWTALLAAKLGAAFNVVEAGQPNRTLIKHPPYEGDVSGISYLKPYLEQSFFDVIIIALGTNDLKKRFDLAPLQIAQGLEKLIDNITHFYNTDHQPKIVILSPAYVQCVGSYKLVYEGSEYKNALISEYFKRVTLDKGVYFFDLQNVVSVSPVDGVHFDAQGHCKIANTIFKILSQDIILV